MTTGYLIEFIGNWQVWLIGFIVVQHLVLLGVGTKETECTFTDRHPDYRTDVRFVATVAEFRVVFCLVAQLGSPATGSTRYLKLPDWWSLIRNALPFTLLALARDCWYPGFIRAVFAANRTRSFMR